MSLQALNQEIRLCTKCNLCKTRKNSLTGEGNTSSRLFLIPQAPGEKENEQNRMFIGPSGEVFRNLIRKAGVDWNDFYISYLIKCMLPHCRKPKQKEIETCSGYLDREIDILAPKILVPLGYYSTKYLMGKYAVAVDFPRKEFPNSLGKIHFIHGVKIFPLAHPATALYLPELKDQMEVHYKKLGILKKVCKWYAVCPMHYYTEQGILDVKWTQLYCMGDWKSCTRYQMEESGQPHPANMLPDGSLASLY